MISKDSRTDVCMCHRYFIYRLSFQSRDELVPRVEYNYIARQRESIYLCQCYPTANLLVRLFENLPAYRNAHEK